MLLVAGVLASLALVPGQASAGPFGSQLLFRDSIQLGGLNTRLAERKCLDCFYRAIQFDNTNGYAFWMPGFYDGDPSHQVRMFFEGAAIFRFDRRAGEANLRGVVLVVDVDDGPGTVGDAFRVDIRWRYRGPGPDGQGRGGPNRELARHQSRQITDQWHYFDLVEGSFNQLGGDRRVAFQRSTTDAKYPLQVGSAASGKNRYFGAASRLTFSHDDGQGRVSTGVGDMHINLVQRRASRVGMAPPLDDLLFGVPDNS